MNRIVLLLSILLLSFIVCGKDWKYPEFSFGKKIVTKDSVETPYGILYAYSVRAGSDRYMIWELTEGDRVKLSVFLKLNGKGWLMRIGEGLATFPVSQDYILSGKMLKNFPKIKQLIKAAEEAFKNAKTRPSALLSYSLFVFLTGKIPSYNPLVNSNGNTTKALASKITCDTCDEIYNGCVQKAEDAYRICAMHCEELSDPKEVQDCKKNICIKGFQDSLKTCLDKWSECRQNCSPPPK